MTPRFAEATRVNTPEGWRYELLTSGAICLRDPDGYSATWHQAGTSTRQITPLLKQAAALQETVAQQATLLRRLAQHPKLKGRWWCPLCGHVEKTLARIPRRQNMRPIARCLTCWRRRRYTVTTHNANAAPSPTRLVVTASWCERGDGSPEQTTAVLRCLVAAFPDARLTMTTFIASRLLPPSRTPIPSEPYEGPVSVESETEVPNRAPTEPERAVLLAQRAARDTAAADALHLTALRLHAHWYERGDADSPELTAVVLCRLMLAFPCTRITSEYDGQGRFHLAGRADMPTSEGTA